jgi:hypothetical protein
MPQQNKNFQRHRIHHNSEPHNSKRISEDHLYINFNYNQIDAKHTFATDVYHLIYGDVEFTHQQMHFFILKNTLKFTLKYT